MRFRFRLLIWLFAIYSIACLAAGIFLAHVTLHPYRRPLPSDAENEMRHVAAGLEAQLESVQITAFDSALLRAWYVHARHGNGDSVILLHGLGDNRLGTVGYAQLLFHHGYSVLMPDARAHGVSGGIYATYGLLERDDISRWFQWLETNQRPHCIFGLGESMGAAQLLQSLQVERSFCAVIAESSFSSFREIGYDRMGQQFHAGPWVGRTVLRPVVEIALAYVHWKYHLELTGASPENSVAHTHVPVLLIHGQKDSNIPVRHSRRIKLMNAEVALWEVPGAAHCGAISSAHEEFEQKIVSWFAMHEHLRASTASQAMSKYEERGFLRSITHVPRESSARSPRRARYESATGQIRHPLCGEGSRCKRRSRLCQYQRRGSRHAR